MPPSRSFDHQDLLAALPPEILALRRFLLWKEQPGLEGKTRKTPYYTNGKRRHGRMDTPEDLAQLATLDEAIDAYLVGDYSGIGLAIVGGDGIASFDLDHCLDAKGKIRKDHAGYALAREAIEMGAYIETSPSGDGLRILGACDEQSAYSKDGLEYWGSKRFVTLTGWVRKNAQGWADLSPLRMPLGVRQKAKAAVDDEDGPIITPKIVEELRSALGAMDSDERDLWVRVGHALKTIGPKGKALWLEWSSKSDKFEPADADRVWDSMEPAETHYRSVFVEAQENWGWQNPRAKKKADPDDDDPEDEMDVPDFIETDLGEQRLYPTEFVLDGFLPASTSVMAGAWGAGKTTNLIPLFASVAHLAPEAWGFRPVLRRHVLWVSEAPDQARDTLYSLAKADGAASWAEFKKWFHLVAAKRMPVKRLAKLIQRMVDEMSHETETGFEVKPVVVLDTTTANIELENESDNSQVAAAMSILKQRLPNIPIVLIGHTPKAMTKADVGDMTFRGAGAWEAEAAATYFLVHDAETDTRFLAARKVRFTLAYKEIDFDHEMGSEIIPTPWGDDQAKSFLHGVPTKSDGSIRKQARADLLEERKEEASERRLSDRQQKILDFIREAMDDGELITRTTIRGAMGGKAELVVAAMDRLIEAELVQVYHPTREEFTDRGLEMKGRVPELVLPVGVDFLAYLDTLAQRRKGRSS